VFGCAGYYSCLSYSMAQLLIEVPYLLGLSIMFVSIVSLSLLCHTPIATMPYTHISACRQAFMPCAQGLNQIMHNAVRLAYPLK